MERLLVANVALDFCAEHHWIGPAPDDIVLHYIIAGGRFEGPDISLSVVANGGDEWGMMGADGVITFESRQVLQTTAEELVYATFSGVYDVGDDGYIDALDDSLHARASAELAIRLYSSSKCYRWLNRVQFFGIGERDFAACKLGLRMFRMNP